MSENNDYSYLLDIIKLAESSEEKADSEKFNLKYHGNFSKNTSVSRVNQGLSYIFLKDSSYNTSIVSNETSVNKLISTHLNKPIDQVDFILSHNEQPFFRLPDSGHWIVMQNWSFGSIPINWIESICDYVDQLWVSSSYEQDCFIQNGIPKEKIRVINSGIDSLYFNYHINPINVNTKKKKKFLFKGDLNWQSGFDILLKAYTDEFVNDEDICLIIVADAKNVSNEYNQKIKELTNLAYSPEILLIDWSDNEDAASLYKACDFIVYPHRAESYCLNLIESMACGTPAIVTNYGAALDYCDINNSILIKASKSYQSDKKIENNETIDFPYWADIDTIDLRVTLRKAYQIDQDIYDNLAKNAS
ncbi:MAG: glycosyltransferase, partial [Candidatus Sericytochromatia bacterium]|nr:glycosyltransferase [Candidatus Sericytochromatia bacterium]